MNPRRTLLGSSPTRLTLLFAALVSTAAPFEAMATPRQVQTGTSEHEIARCIRQASRGKPWLEKTLWGLRDQEGGWVGAEIPNRDGSHDLGPLQVNSWWVQKLANLTGRPTTHVRWWLTHDPCFNVNAGRWIFLSALNVTRDYWKAVGVYHSPTGWRQRRYVLSVASKLRQRFGSDVFADEMDRHHATD